MTKINLDKLFEEIKDKPDALYRIHELELVWTFDYELINDLRKTNGLKPIEQSYEEYEKEIFKNISELERRFKEYNENKYKSKS